MTDFTSVKSDIYALRINDKVQDLTLEDHKIYFKIIGIGIGYVMIVVTGIAIALIVKMI